LRSTITAFPESELLNGKLIFRKNEQAYPVAITPMSAAPVKLSARLNLVSTFKNWWGALMNFLKKSAQNSVAGGALKPSEST